MEIAGWKYYNHAAIPATAPHEHPNMDPIEDGTIWKINGGTPLLARWTTDFDCGYETNWWYVIKDKPFEIESLNSKTKKHIRQALKKVSVMRICMNHYSESLCLVHNNACKGYSTFSGDFVTAFHFQNYKEPVDCWGAFSTETNQLVAYMICRRRNDYVETVTAKYDPQYLNLRASDAMHFTILEHYLNEEGFAYICSGSRTINHTTNAQAYKISTFGFRKAYCDVHIVYNPKVKWLIKLLFPFRKLIYRIDMNKITHQINSVMRMEELIREKK